jgi:hypothetical protein
VAAAFELNGSAGGLAAAAAVAASGPGAGANLWDFGRKTVAGAVSSFAPSPAGPFEAAPASAAGIRFIRVSSGASVPLHFASLLPGVGQTAGVSASATAGQLAKNQMGNGLAPFSPDAHDPVDPHFGFTEGERYTLKWAPNGQRDKPGGSCSGDVGFDPGGSSDRGYLDVGQGSGNSALRSAIVNNNFFLPNELVVGGPLPMMVPGEKNTNTAIAERFAQDTDVTSTTYSDYHGNGRRILIVVVNDHDPGSPRVAGFAAMFLPPDACGPNNTDPCCAEYIGPAVLGGDQRGGSTTGGTYAVELVD